MTKYYKGFDDSLTLFSLWGFVALAVLIFLKLDIISWQTSILMILAGLGLMYEGNIVTLRSWTKDGVDRREITWILAIVVGLFSVVVGILKIPFIALVGPKIDTIVGLISIFAASFIVFQRYYLRR